MIDKDLVKKARQTNLVDYLIQRGEPLKRVSARHLAQRYVYGGCFRTETWEEYKKRKNSPVGNKKEVLKCIEILK